MRTQMAITSGVTASYALSMNSLYDPDVTAIGSQPEYFDFWSQLYQYYRVWNSKIKVLFSSNSANDSIAVAVTPYAFSSTSITGMSEIMMLPYTKHKVIGPN